MFGSDQLSLCMLTFEFSRPGDSISKRPEPTPMPRRRMRSYARSLSGMAPRRAWHADGAILDWDHAPPDLREAFEAAAPLPRGTHLSTAAIWNFATLGFPFLPPERVIDVMVQAGVSNLPTDLEHASRYLGGEGKQKDGKELIKLFCIEGAAPSAHPEEWQRFLTYARQDVEAMREVYRRTRPLPREEWEQFWAFEHVNRRGVERRHAVRALALRLSPPRTPSPAAAG